MSELIWIAVPGGLTDDAAPHGARLRVAIVPRLDGPSLDSDGLAHWPPPPLIRAALSVDFARTPGVDLVTVEVPPPHIKPQSGVWDAFFGAGTIVRARGRAGTTGPAIEVEDTSTRARAVQRTFDECAKTAISAASSATLATAVRTQLATHWQADADAASPSPLPAPAPAPPNFHQMIDWLREHPAVLRALGLIVELSLPAGSIPSNLATGVVRVRWPDAPRPPAFPEIVSPWSQYGREFFPGSTANISAGMVTLTPDGTPPPPEPRWEVVTVDVSGAATRLRGAARALVTPPDSGDTTDVVSLPALRTAGLMLLRRGRAADFAARRAASDTNARRASLADAVLTADDLTLGYRVDVSFFGSTEWFSLQRRAATYTVGDLTIGERDVEEEGHVKAHAATSDGAGMMRADEIVVRWNGWSLAVAQPTFENGRRRPPRERRNALPFDFHWAFTVPAGSLPPLRFSKQYRLRARVADLAGGGLKVKDAAANRCVTAIVPFRRYEPVPSPAVTLPNDVEQTALGPGESVDVVVIRSDAGSVADFAAEQPRYGVHPRRLLWPPRASLEMAERHGMLDNQPIERTLEVLRRAAAREHEAASMLPDPAAGGICAFPRSEPGGLLATRADQEWNELWPDLKLKALELREGVLGGVSPIAWQHDPKAGDLLVVMLAKAEQVTIELSTFLRENFFDQFALSNVSELPSTSPALAEQGRHPMITPARPVTLVHAVRKPLKNPQGTLTPQRQPGETCAVLDPAPTLLGVDANSTAQIDVTARWPERRDDRPAEPTTASVQSVIVHRGDAALRDVLRHEFGDTRHRAVTYTITALSRFRRYFDDREEPSAFMAETTLAGPVMIPSTARPAPLVLLAARPAFAWTDARESTGMTQVIRRQRLGGHVRLEIERPWFQTGDGERLAVIVSSDGRPSAQAAAFLTQAGKDPIWDTTLPPRWPTRAMFAAAADRGDQAARLEELGELVDVVTYEPWFHHDRWYVDIVMPRVASTSYSPLVQLAVGRYQAQSLLDPRQRPALDLRLSRVVKTEFVSLLPERTLTITRTNARVDVRLDGLGPSGLRENRVEVVLEHAALPAGVPVSAIALTSFDSEVTDPIAWRALPGQERRGALGAVLAFDIPGGPGPFRVRVREVELIGTADVGAPQLGGALGELAERTVFTDAVLIPAI